MKRVVASVVVAFLLVGLLPAAALAATGPKVTVQPGGGAAGVAWSQQPQVSILTGKNVETTATGTITLSIKAGSGTSGATLSCAALTVTLVGGVAAFSGCSIDIAGTGYRLTATWSQGGHADSGNFNITGAVGLATKLGFTVQPARGTPGGAFAVQPSIALQTAAGATVTGAPATSITLALGANPGGGTLSCTGGVAKTTVSGVATFNGCTLDKVGVGYTLVASASALASATSALFDVADQLAFTTQPTGAAVGLTLATQPVVAIRAGASATATHDSTTSVTLSIKAGTGAPGAILTCTGGLSKVAVNGVATFAGCAINKASPTPPPNPYQLVATAGGLTSATSSPFTLGSTANLTVTNSASVITWGSQVMITVRFDQAGANRAVQLQGTRDGVNWTTIVTLGTDPSGIGSFVYRPATNLFYRAVFAGAPDLGALTSNTTRTVVRQIALLRPTNFGAIRSIARNRSITFTTTVRPSRPELPAARVSFVFYHRVGSFWTLVTRRDVFINSLGKASTTFRFTVAGSWYVRTIANPTPYNANSVWSPLERYRVR
jgi:hypothetical protein